MTSKQQSWRNCEYAFGTKPIKGGLIVKTKTLKEIESYDCENNEISGLNIYPTEMVTVGKCPPIETPILYMPRPIGDIVPDEIKKKQQKDIKLGLAMCMHCKCFEPKIQKIRYRARSKYENKPL
jgi:hypothetical protein